MGTLTSRPDLVAHVSRRRVAVVVQVRRWQRLVHVNLSTRAIGCSGRRRRRSGLGERLVERRQGLDDRGLVALDGRLGEELALGAFGLCAAPARVALLEPVRLAEGLDGRAHRPQRKVIVVAAALLAPPEQRHRGAVVGMGRERSRTGPQAALAGDRARQQKVSGAAYQIRRRSTHSN